jgi:dolichyl-phosphate-mannose--protein O-mannosyl transferase
MAMDDVIFLMIAIAFVLLALLFVVATLNASPIVRRIANRVVYSSCVAALVSVVLAVWFLFRPPA